MVALPHIKAESGTVPVSIGVKGLVPNETTSPEELIGMADEALYESKKRGRNRVQAAE
jgi:two-component system, cell cycle response regulator